MERSATCRESFATKPSRSVMPMSQEPMQRRSRWRVLGSQIGKSQPWLMRYDTAGSNTATTKTGCFEREFAAATGRAHAIALPSCTVSAAPEPAGPRHWSRRRGHRAGDDLDRHRCADHRTSERRRSSSTSSRKPGACRSTSCATALTDAYSGDHRRRPVRWLSRTGRIRGTGGRVRHPPHRGLGTRPPAVGTAAGRRVRSAPRRRSASTGRRR